METIILAFLLIVGGMFTGALLSAFVCLQALRDVQKERDHYKEIFTNKYDHDTDYHAY